MRRWCLLFLLGLSACGGGGETVSLNDLNDEEPGPFDKTPPAAGEVDPFVENERLGRGMNLGNALEAPKEGDWGVVLNSDYFQLVKDAGFDSVRIPIKWSAHAEAGPPYTIDPEFFDRVDWAVGHALSRDMYAVINIHHYDEIMDEPEAHRERLGALWRQIAEHYRDYPKSLLFEVLNEPRKNLGDELWNDMFPAVVATIRESNPGRTLILGGTFWNNLDKLPVVAWPEADLNIIGTFHFYDPHPFTHQGAGSQPIGPVWEGTAEEQAELKARLDLVTAWSESAKRPAYMGEFGVRAVADQGSRERWTRFVVAEANARKFSWAYWELVSEFAAYEKGKGWNEPLRAALLQ